MHSYNHFLLLLISLGAVLHHRLIVTSVTLQLCILQGVGVAATIAAWMVGLHERRGYTMHHLRSCSVH